MPRVSFFTIAPRELKDRDTVVVAEICVATGATGDRMRWVCEQSKPRGGIFTMLRAVSPLQCGSLSTPGRRIRIVTAAHSRH
jgi:hypothetical protein